MPQFHNLFSITVILHRDNSDFFFWPNCLPSFFPLNNIIFVFTLLFKWQVPFEIFQLEKFQLNVLLLQNIKGYLNPAKNILKGHDTSHDP